MTQTGFIFVKSVYIVRGAMRNITILPTPTQLLLADAFCLCVRIIFNFQHALSTLAHGETSRV